MIFGIDTDGNMEVIDGGDGEPTLKQLYAWIDCELIEVPGSGFSVNGEEIHFIVDEEGKLKGKPINVVATSLYNNVLSQDPRGLQSGIDTLNGTVVVLTGKHLLK